MNRWKTLWRAISAPQDYFYGAPVAQKSAPPQDLPIGSTPGAQTAPQGAFYGAPLAQTRSNIGSRRPARGSKNTSDLLTVCDWCGACTRIVYVAGHGQCGSCHRVLEECCTGERAEKIPNPAQTSLDGHQRESGDSGATATKQPRIGYHGRSLERRFGKIGE